jgi:hypothetical protein
MKIVHSHRSQFGPECDTAELRPYCDLYHRTILETNMCRLSYHILAEGDEGEAAEDLFLDLAEYIDTSKDILDTNDRAKLLPYSIARMCDHAEKLLADWSALLMGCFADTSPEQYGAKLNSILDYAARVWSQRGALTYTQYSVVHSIQEFMRLRVDRLTAQVDYMQRTLPSNN